ncbi:MAG TPA: PilZ domain-containing protein [Methylomirabilota bacterium]|jgi:Tfp pilus assembly protein PilZ|nr:PilZ domain-containing protein [Methylomirabilota bacterium]
MPRSSDSAERRQSARFPVAGTIRTEKGAGIARDVSTTGLFFETDEPYTVGESVSLSLVLERPYSAVPVRLQGTGRVVRVEQRGRKTGIGVAVTWGLIERHEPPQ